MCGAIFARKQILPPRFLANCAAHEAPYPHRPDRRDVSCPPGRAAQHEAPADPLGRADGLGVDRAPLCGALHFWPRSARLAAPERRNLAAHNEQQVAYHRLAAARVPRLITADIHPAHALHAVREVGGELPRIGFGVDVRTGAFLEGAGPALDELIAMGHDVEVLFLDCADDVLIRRFAELLDQPPMTCDARLARTRGIGAQVELVP